MINYGSEVSTAMELDAIFFRIKLRITIVAWRNKQKVIERKNIW